jgi:hypothetical protein
LIPDSNIFGLQGSDHNFGLIDDGGCLFLEVGKTPPCNIIVGEKHRVSFQSVNVFSSDIMICIYLFIIGWIILILEYTIDFVVPWEVFSPIEEIGVCNYVIESKDNNRCSPTTARFFTFLVCAWDILSPWYIVTQKTKLVYLPTGHRKH